MTTNPDNPHYQGIPPTGPPLKLWRRLLLRTAGFRPAAVWDCPGDSRVFYEDEPIPDGSTELWDRKSPPP